MPELPEVEVVVRQLRAVLVGEVFQAATVHHPDVFQPGRGRSVADLEQRAVTGVERRAKLILIELEGELTLTVHLRMTGALEMVEAHLPRKPHTHLTIDLPSSRQLRYVDPRRFGRVQLLGAAELAADGFLSRLGPEPLGMSRAELDRGLASRVGTLKGALLDQSLVAGLGNIYADEILFRAGLHPRLVACRLQAAELDRLHHQVQLVLTEAIAAGGSTIADYRSLESPGQFQRRHQVFGRDGQACLRCGATIKKIKVVGRGTHVCPTCQPHRRRRRALRRRARPGG